MATLVKMPKWGLTMTVGTVTDWFIEEGAEVSEGDPIFTVETEKAVNDVESPADGVLIKIVAGSGEEVLVSAPVAVIAAPGESLSDDELSALIAAAAPARPRERAGAGGLERAARPSVRNEGGRINASPAARRRAQELGVDLAEIEATGPDGRITSDDVERAAAATGADPTPREERIRLNDGRELHVLRAGGGGGVPLVFLHGLGGSQSTWQVVLGELVSDHRAAAFDLPGHGASDKSPGADYTIDGIAGAIQEGIGQLNMERPILIGHSLGGAIALRIAAQSPELLVGVIVIDSAGLGNEISSELTALMAGPAGTATARGLLELFYEDKRLVTERSVQEMALSQMAEGAWPAQQAVSAAAFTGDRQLQSVLIDVSAVRIPVAILWGERDRVLPPQHAFDMLARFSDASLTVIRGVGHVPQIENARRTAELIGRFSRSLLPE